MAATSTQALHHAHLLIDPSHSALVLVDYQERLLPALQHGAEALAHALHLADIARELGVPVVGTEQNPAKLGLNTAAVRERCGITLAKMHFDACADGLVELLRPPAGAPVREVVVAGCEAHVCLLQTALGLQQAGLRVWVVAEACASRRSESHALAMQRLQQAGVTLVNVEMVAFEWLRSCEHPRFRAVLPGLKAR